MFMMNVIGEWVDSLHDWASNETNEIKRFCKFFVAGFVDGWLYGCTVIGLALSLVGTCINIKKLISKK